MVPRAYLYTSPPLASSLSKPDGRNVSVSEQMHPASTSVARKEVTAGMVKPVRISSAPPTTPSKPVVIPTRTRHGGQRRGNGQILRIRSIPEDADIPHDPQSITASTAALLAMTSLPRSIHTSNSQSRRKRSRLALSDDEGNSLDSEVSRQASSSSSPRSWGVLLSPPNECEQDVSSITCESTLGPLCSVRSLSSESMPSLEADMESSGSVSNPSTPGIPMGKRSGGERRTKTLSSSTSEDCVLDHPLLPGTPECGSDSEGVNDDVKPLVAEIRRSASSKSSFKSNLTASLRILKSAAASFSYFTAPVLHRDDYIARSLLSISPQFTDERRPLPSADVPDPALRRYLNPITVSPVELHFHHDQRSGSNCTASIQLQPYRRGLKSSSKASAPPVFTSHPLSRVSDETFTTASSRQREPRENSDFLRVVVLEMNMRKVGKLSDASPGRAKLWLPARQDASPSEVDEAAGVPKRWVGTIS